MRRQMLHQYCFVCNRTIVVDPRLRSPSVPFDEVPDESIRALWQEFNLCATGWGVCPKFFDQLCQAMAKSMGIESNETSNKDFFATLDTDKVRGHHGAAFRTPYYGKSRGYRGRGDSPQLEACPARRDECHVL